MDDRSAQHWVILFAAPRRSPTIARWVIFPARASGSCPRRHLRTSPGDRPRRAVAAFKAASQRYSEILHAEVTVLVVRNPPVRASCAATNPARLAIMHATFPLIPRTPIQIPQRALTCRQFSGAHRRTGPYQSRKRAWCSVGANFLALQASCLSGRRSCYISGVHSVIASVSGIALTARL